MQSIAGNTLSGTQNRKHSLFICGSENALEIGFPDGEKKKTMSKHRLCILHAERLGEGEAGTGSVSLDDLQALLRAYKESVHLS